jgi:hypothetical protein
MREILYPEINPNRNQLESAVLEAIDEQVVAHRVRAVGSATDGTRLAG